MNFVRHIQEHDRFANANHIRLVEVTDAYAIAEAPIREECMNADNVAQGGFIFTLADLCFTYLSNHLHPRTVTQAVSATYVAPGTGSELTAKAVELSCTRRNNVVSVTVTNDQGTTVAIFQFNGFIIPLAD